MEGKFAMFVVICVGLITTEAFPNQTPTGKNGKLLLNLN